MKVIELEVLHEWLLSALIAGVILYYFDLVQIMERITFMILARIYGIVSLSSRKDEIKEDLRAECNTYMRNLWKFEERFNKIVKDFDIIRAENDEFKKNMSNSVEEQRNKIMKDNDEYKRNLSNSMEEQRNKIMKDVEVLRRANSNEFEKKLSKLVQDWNKIMKEMDQVRRAENDEIVKNFTISVDECKKMIKDVVARADNDDFARMLLESSVEERCKKVMKEVEFFLVLRMADYEGLVTKFSKHVEECNKLDVVRRADNDEFARKLLNSVEERCNKVKKDVEVVRRADLVEISKRVTKFVDERCNKAVKDAVRIVHKEKCNKLEEEKMKMLRVLEEYQTYHIFKEVEENLLCLMNHDEDKDKDKDEDEEAEEEEDYLVIDKENEQLAA